MNKIAKYLNQHIIGNVFDQPAILENYSTDRSVLKITPKMVAFPESTADVRKIVKFVDQLADKHIRLPITVRGSGLDKTGADLGSGIIISTEHLNHIQEIDDHSRLVRVQAGVTLGQLNSALALYGLTIPVFADPRQTIGGLISNFITDSGAGKYNGIYYYVDCLEAITANGDAIQTARLNHHFLPKKTSQDNLEGKIYRDIAKLIREQSNTVSDLGSRAVIDSAGYQMVTQVYRGATRSFDLLPLFYGAQGTLGVITEVILRCEPYRAQNFHFVAAFESVNAAQSYIQTITPLEPAELNIYDARMFREAIEHGKDPALFAPKFYDGYFVLANFDDKPRKIRKKLKKCLNLLPSNSAAVCETEENTIDFQRLNSAIISYLNDDVRGERISLVDDFYVPSEHFVNFLTELKTLEKTYSMELHVFGSYATSNYSIRPDIQMNTVEGRQFCLKFLKDFHSLLKEYGGSLTGGAPEGRVKAALALNDFKDEELKLYHSIKEIFDKKNILNPDVKLGIAESSLLRNLRTEANSVISVE